jgi:hypothetical protein
MQTYNIVHIRPIYGRAQAQPVGSWTVVAPTWREALLEAHQGIPMEQGDVLVWLS